MKTFKYLSMMLVMLAMSMNFVSCNEEKVPPLEEPEGFIGTWFYADSGGSITFQFNSNGSGSRVITLTDSSGNSVTSSESFQYTYTETATGKGTIQVHISGDNSVYTWSYTLTGNTLMITDSDGVWVLSRR